jgi:hypothetical protein
MKQSTLFWGGVLVVGWWLMKNKAQNAGPATNALGFGGNPNDQNLNQMESANWWSKWMQGTPATATPVSPRLPSDTGEQIRRRIDAGVYGL